MVLALECFIPPQPASKELCVLRVRGYYLFVVGFSRDNQGACEGPIRVEISCFLRRWSVDSIGCNAYCLLKNLDGMGDTYIDSQVKHFPSNFVVQDAVILPEVVVVELDDHTCESPVIVEGPGKTWSSFVAVYNRPAFPVGPV